MAPALPAQFDALAPRLQNGLRLVWIAFFAIAVVGQAVGVARATTSDDSGLAVWYVPVALIYLLAAILLQRRRPGDPVSMILSFAFLAIAGSIYAPILYWEALQQPQIGYAWLGLGLYLLILAFLLFPDGRFDPPWTRWAMVVGPIALLAILASSDIGAQAMVGGVGIAVVVLAMRYRRSEPGLERQQIKWAAFGFLTGIPAIGIGFGLLDLLPRGYPYTMWGGIFLILAGKVLVPAGIIISLLRIRLNDADAWIGRSTGVAMASAIAICVLAAGAEAFEQIVKRLFGAGNEIVAQAFVGLVAFAIFAPAQGVALNWAKRRFQPALSRLQTLGDRLAQWQPSQDSEHLAAGALTIIVKGVNAKQAAIICGSGPNERVLALRRLDDRADAVELRSRVADVSDPILYPLRFPLKDHRGVSGTLLIGPRSDDASYRRDELRAIESVVAPLADALRTTAVWERRNESLMATLAGISSKLEDLTAKLDAFERRRPYTATT